MPVLMIGVYWVLKLKCGQLPSFYSELALVNASLLEEG